MDGALSLPFTFIGQSARNDHFQTHGFEVIASMLEDSVNGGKKNKTLI